MSSELPRLDGFRTLKFAVSDCARSLAFYERAFGAQRIPEADHLDPHGNVYAYICRVEGLGVLDLRLLPTHAASAARFDPVSIHVADKAALHAWAEHLDRLGDMHHSGVFATGLTWALAVEDPDGRFIKLFSRVGHGPEVKPDKDNPWMKN